MHLMIKCKSWSRGPYKWTSKSRSKILNDKRVYGGGRLPILLYSALLYGVAVQDQYYTPYLYPNIMSAFSN